jgi:hypothetical protein
VAGAVQVTSVEREPGAGGDAATAVGGGVTDRGTGPIGSRGASAVVVVVGIVSGVAIVVDDGGGGDETPVIGADHDACATPVPIEPAIPTVKSMPITIRRPRHPDRA